MSDKGIHRTRDWMNDMRPIFEKAKTPEDKITIALVMVAEMICDDLKTIGEILDRIEKNGRATQ